MEAGADPASFARATESRSLRELGRSPCPWRCSTRQSLTRYFNTSCRTTGIAITPSPATSSRSTPKPEQCRAMGRRLLSMVLPQDCELDAPLQNQTRGAGLERLVGRGRHAGDRGGVQYRGGPGSNGAAFGSAHLDFARKADARRRSLFPTPSMENMVGLHHRRFAIGCR
jgi:hypothetical protein